MNTNTMNEHERNRTLAVRPARVKGLGGQGVEAVTWLLALLGAIFRKTTGKLPLVIQAIDTDHSSAGVRKRLRPTLPAVALGPEQLMVLPPTPVSELRTALLRDPATRAYGERIPATMSTETRTGAGKERSIAFAMGIVNRTIMGNWITEGAQRVRDSRSISEAADQGIIVNLDAPDLTIDMACAAGGTGTGLAPLSAMLEAECAQRMGRPDAKRVLLLGMPLVGYGGDPVQTAVNAVALVREICLSHLKPGRAAIRNFGGDELRIDQPLYSRVYLFCGGNRHVTAASREAVSFQMATAALHMVLGDSANALDSEEQDTEVSLADVHPVFGPRVMARFGAARIAYDPETMVEAVAAAGAARLAEYFRQGMVVPA